jgi:hypothetical protein
MQALFLAVRVVLPLSLSEEVYQDPAHREQIRASLHALAKSAGILAQHSRDTDPGFEYVGRSLERDSKEIFERFEQNRFEESRFLLFQVTENCIACHSKLPSPEDSPVSGDFLDQTAFAGLGARDRAKLQLATRQFDAALASWEALFGSPEENPAILLGPVTDYLTVCIRVKNDYARPIPVLSRFGRRPDLWRYLRWDVQRWVKSLKAFEDSPPPATLASARELIDQAKQLVVFPADRQGLVHYVAASTVLHGYIKSRPSGGADVAEAYYLLGVTEARIGRTYWIEQASFYLETAIRMAPGAPFSEKAYMMLEEQAILEHTGTQGVHLPEDVTERLAELRLLIDTAPAVPSL